MALSGSLLSGPNIPAIKLMIKGLRSGEYNQIRETLMVIYPTEGFKVPGHCCLGVLSCEIADQDFIINSSYEFKTYSGFGEWRSDTIFACSGLPVDLAYKIFGQRGSDIQNKLIGMNDDRNRSFEFIARWLEVYFGIKDLNEDQ